MMEKKERLTEIDRVFVRGYIACLCNVMDAMGGCDADIREAWKALGLEWHELRKYDIESYDRGILKKYRKEILKLNNR